MIIHSPFIVILNTIRRLKNVLVALILFGLCITVFRYFPRNAPENYRLARRSHSLCVIVPFRDRFDELLEFTPHLSEFLDNHNVKYRIFVVNQVDSLRFNRGSLINVGFKYSDSNVSDCDYVAMHDVDLLPLNDKISYEYPGDRVFHASSPALHPKYHYRTFVGGILLISSYQFRNVNGLSNRYWGWGLEDDEFYLRLKDKKIGIDRPENIGSDHTNSFKHIHEKKRKRDMQRCYNQAKASLKRDRQTGLSNVQYTILAVHSLTINNYGVTVLNVKLKCNRSVTPWCICESLPIFNSTNLKVI